MKDLKRFITKAIKPDKTQIIFDPGNYYNFFAYVIYNSFQTEEDVSSELQDFADDDLDFCTSLDDFDQSHMADYLPYDNWVRDILLNSMIPYYEYRQFSYYIGDDDDAKDAIHDAKEFMQLLHFPKKKLKEVLSFFKDNSEYAPEIRFFIPVITGEWLRKIYKHPRLRELFEQILQLSFIKPNIASEGIVVYNDVGDHDMLEISFLQEYIEEFNRRIKKHKRPHKENLEFALKVRSLSDNDGGSSKFIKLVLSIFDTKSQVMF